ncbi:MAG: FAD-dependent thymidylate synthase [Treponemataceae bacterium]|nr:FAD-dependent thymidylate synthase [Treponemataceae bacterium]
MAHCFVDAAEKILDKEFPVLDKGFVRLVDYLGSDERVVQAARVSYGAGTKTYREDAALIDYLLRNEHTSPFEQVVLTFHIKLPIFVARQMVRHRTARLNEISGRYSVMKDDFYVPALEDIALQSTDNKQGRMTEPVDPDTGRAIQEQLKAGQREAYEEYQKLLDQGLARELARINLPLSLYTEWYWQMDLHNLFHFLKLRLDPHAQKEIRAYAQVMFDIARAVAPRCCESFERHILGGVHFSREEFAELQRRLGIETSVSNGKECSHTEKLTGKNLERFEEKLRTGQQR